MSITTYRNTVVRYSANDSTYTLIANLIEGGDFNLSADMIEATKTTDTIKRKYADIPNATQRIRVLYDPADAGMQLLMSLVGTTGDPYYFKIEHGGDTTDFIKFRAHVAGVTVTSSRGAMHEADINFEVTDVLTLPS